jgi:hypothetical protein
MPYIVHTKVRNDGSKAVEAFGIKLAVNEGRDHQIERDPNCQGDWTFGPFRRNLRADNTNLSSAFAL